VVLGTRAHLLHLSHPVLHDPAKVEPFEKSQSWPSVEKSSEKVR